MLAFYNKNDGVRVTDLHQGIVWGTQTEHTRLDDRLINRFDYDGDYGTVLNRFLMQAAIGYPLTVHGTGGQTRAFIHLQDSVRCIQLAIEHPPEPGERVRIFNQMTEIAPRASTSPSSSRRLTGADIDLVDNPRKEAAENDLTADNRACSSSGWTRSRSRTRCCTRGDGDRGALPRPLRRRPDPVPVALGAAEAARARLMAADDAVRAFAAAHPGLRLAPVAAVIPALDEEASIAGRARRRSRRRACDLAVATARGRRRQPRRDGRGRRGARRARGPPRAQPRPGRRVRHRLRARPRARRALHRHARRRRAVGPGRRARRARAGRRGRGRPRARLARPRPGGDDRRRPPRGRPGVQRADAGC